MLWGLHLPIWGWNFALVSQKKKLRLQHEWNLPTSWFHNKFVSKSYTKNDNNHSFYLFTPRIFFLICAKLVLLFWIAQKYNNCLSKFHTPKKKLTLPLVSKHKFDIKYKIEFHQPPILVVIGDWSIFILLFHVLVANLPLTLYFNLRQNQNS